MRAESYKTTELSDPEVKKYLIAFNTVFKTCRTLDEFKHEYINTCKGYSYHVFLYNENNDICGAYSAIPFIYEVRGKNQLFAVATDMFIADAYRNNIKNLISVLNAIISFLKDNGVSAFFGFPNDNSDKVSLAFIKKKRIGLLDTYILPYKIGAYKNSLKIFNPFSVLLSACMLWISRMSNNVKEVNYTIRKSRPVFDNTRWNWFKPEEYHKYRDNTMSAVWKVSEFDGTKACFLLDVYPMSKLNFDKAVRIMVKQEKKKSGLFIFVGHLNFIPLSMMKIPRRFEPKTFRFDCRILDSSKLNENDVFNIDNWEVNLSSYDLL